MGRIVVIGSCTLSRLLSDRMRESEDVLALGTDTSAVADILGKRLKFEADASTSVWLFPPDASCRSQAPLVLSACVQSAVLAPLFYKSGCWLHVVSSFHVYGNSTGVPLEPFTEEGVLNLTRESIYSNVVGDRVSIYRVFPMFGECLNEGFAATLVKNKAQGKTAKIPTDKWTDLSCVTDIAAALNRMNFEKDPSVFDVRSGTSERILDVARRLGVKFKHADAPVPGSARLSSIVPASDNDIQTISVGWSEKAFDAYVQLATTRSGVRQ